MAVDIDGSSDTREATRVGNGRMGVGTESVSCGSTGGKDAGAGDGSRVGVGAGGVLGGEAGEVVMVNGTCSVASGE